MKRCDNPSCETCGGTGKVDCPLMPEDEGAACGDGCSYEDRDCYDFPCPTCGPDAEGERVPCPENGGMPISEGITDSNLRDDG